MHLFSTILGYIIMINLALVAFVVMHTMYYAVMNLGGPVIKTDAGMKRLYKRLNISVAVLFAMTIVHHLVTN